MRVEVASVLLVVISQEEVVGVFVERWKLQQVRGPQTFKVLERLQSAARC